MWYWHDGLGGWDWLWMAIMMGLMWIPIVLLAVWLLASLTRGRNGGLPGASDPLVAARIAYARGEITREQYFEIIDDLGGAPPAPRERDTRGAA